MLVQIKKLCIYSGVCMIIGLLSITNAFSQTLVYSQTFTGGASSAPQCGPWITFCNSINLSNTYASITISGGGSATATGAVAQAIATALKNNTTYSGASGGFNWAVDNWGSCNAGGTAGPELTATGALCTCNSGYTVRPCINNVNWGNAAGGATCGAGTQTMTVTLVVAGPPCSWSGWSGTNYPTIPCGSFSSNIPVGSGTYTYFTAIAGNSYTVSTCGSSFDTDLTIYDANPAWTARAWNQDNGPDCAGTNASLTWTATYSGDHIAIVNRAGCQQHDFTGTSAVLKFRNNSCGCTPNQPATTWNGSVNNNWNNNSNWSNCVPGVNTNTTIPVVGSGIYPVLNGGAAYVNTITVNPGASVTVNSPATLTSTQ